jgi:Flp pilus assembly CpaE family ATPase
LESVLRRAVDLRPGPRNAPAGTGKVCCVFPAKGNSGATMIAGNLAQQAKLLGAKQVLLADMDPLTGTLSFVFKLKAQYNLADALAHAGSLDADLWKALVTSYRGIDVLTCPDSPLNCSVETQDPAVVLEYCRRSYEMIFLDGGSPYGEWNLRLARLSDQILLVLTAELPAVYAAQRALAYLDRHGIVHSRIRLVLNRHRRDAGFDPEEVEKALGVPVFHVLPNDHATAQSALLEGKPLSAASQLGKALADLAAHLGNRPSPEPKGASSGGLLSLFTR